MQGAALVSEEDENAENASPRRAYGESFEENEYGMRRGSSEFPGGSVNKNRHDVAPLGYRKKIWYP